MVKHCALEIVLDAIKETRMALIRNGETPATLKEKYRLQIPRHLIVRAIEESELTAKHPTTGKMIKLGSLDGREFFAMRVTVGDEIAIVPAERAGPEYKKEK